MSLLLLSDIHMNKKNVQAVVEWYARERPPISYILLLGDFHNIDNWSEAPDEKHLEDVRELLAPIDGLGIPCFLIPGNHDPPSMFVDGARLGTHIENIHNRVVSLREDLQILAFGGSVPGLLNQTI
jgi:Icc-related predicted phosphoesterase